MSSTVDNTDQVSEDVYVSTKNIEISSKISEASTDEILEEKKSDSKDQKDDTKDKDTENDKDNSGDKDNITAEVQESLIAKSAKSIRNWLFKAESKETNAETNVKVEGDVELQSIPSVYLFSLEVELKSGTALIYFQEGDDPHKLAKEFGKKHKLPKRLVKKLSIMIREKHLEYIKLSSASEDDENNSLRSLKVSIYDIVNQSNKPPEEKIRSPKASAISSKVL